MHSSNTKLILSKEEMDKRRTEIGVRQCVACGSTNHKGINEHFKCLENEIIKIRIEMDTYEKELDKIRSYSKEVYKLKCTEGGMFEQLKSPKTFKGKVQE